MVEEEVEAGDHKFEVRKYWVQSSVFRKYWVQSILILANQLGGKNCKLEVWSLALSADLGQSGEVCVCFSRGN